MLPEVDVEGHRHLQVARQLRGLLDRQASRVLDEGYAPEVDERGPGQELPGNVLRREQLFGGRVGAVKGEQPISVVRDLHEGQRGAGGRFAPTDAGGDDALRL